MFKSIRWKLVIMFILMVVSVIVLVGTFFRISISDFYINEFKSTVSSAFYGEFFSQIQNASVDEMNIDSISSVIEAYSGRLGIDMFRNVYLLDGKTGKVLNRTDKNSFDTIEKTPNIIAALNGKDGKEINEQNSYMDYARPIFQNGEIGFVLYIKDTKEELAEVIGTILKIILQALLFGLCISFILGYFMSKTITSPIISLTRRAELMSTGNFENRIDVKSDDEIGQLTQTFNTMATKLKDNLTTIEDEKNKIETILLFMTDGVVAFDSSGTVTHINHAAEKMLNLTDHSDIRFDIYFENLGADISLSELVFKKDETLERDIIVNDRHLQVFFASIFSEPEIVSAVIVVLRDITEQHKLELSRREFVSNVSHELRTPITTIKSYTETILESDELPKETLYTFLNVVHSEADRMTRLVYDLLELSRLDYDGQSMTKDYFDIQHLLTDVCQKLTSQFESHNHKMTLSFANNIGLFYGNRDRIEQVLTNIIVNAIKYTRTGGDIKISAGNVYDNIYIKIRDNGIGIPKEDLDYVFDRFYRVDKARSRQNGGGTGLGLAIAKEIVTAHNGTISIKSQIDLGTEVTLKFPCKKDVMLT